MKYETIQTEWLSLGVLHPRNSDRISRRLGSVLKSWESTPKMLGQQCKGVGVDCIRFVTGVLDEMYRMETKGLPTLPPDTAMFDRTTAMSAMKAILDRYGPNRINIEPVEGKFFIEPGDVFVTGTKEKDSPGHALIAGPNPNTLWHANDHMVCRTGMGFLQHGALHLFKVFRLTNKHLWI